jgi:hypothetical protein
VHMERSVYVAGAVLDVASRHEATIYRTIVELAETRGLTAAVSVRDHYLDAMTARDFAEEITSRIAAAEYVVTIVTGTDPSPPVEAALASGLGKSQIIVSPGGQAPRILAGLRGVRAVVNSDDPSAVRVAVRDLFEGLPA